MPAGRRIRYLTVPERTGKQNESAHSNQAQRMLDVFEQEKRIGINDHHVIRVFIHPWQNRRRGSRDESHVRVVDSRLSKQRIRVLVILVLGIDGRELRPGSTAQQPEATHAESRTNFDDRTRVHAGREDGHLRTHSRANRVDAVLLGQFTSALNGWSLDREVLRVHPVHIVLTHEPSLPGFSLRAKSACTREYSRRVFGLTFEKLLLIGLIAVLVVGPDRLPAAAAGFARFVRALRDFANGAKSRVQEELGPDYDDIDWKKLDPRQYDPRRIIREALLEDSSTSSPSAADKPPVRASGSSVSGSSVSGSRVSAAARNVSAATPFDGEST